MNIQWYPGHMTKTRRMIAEQIKNVDAVCEILDARIPVSSRNPDVDELTAGKPRMVVLNRVDQADPEGTKRWAEHFRAKGYAVLESDAKSGVGTAKFAGAVRELLADKLRAYAEKALLYGNQKPEQRSSRHIALSHRCACRSQYGTAFHGRVRQCGDVCLFLHFGEYATAIFGSLWLD